MSSAALLNISSPSTLSNSTSIFRLSPSSRPPSPSRIPSPTSLSHATSRLNTSRFTLLHPPSLYQSPLPTQRGLYPIDGSLKRRREGEEEGEDTSKLARVTELTSSIEQTNSSTTSKDGNGEQLTNNQIPYSGNFNLPDGDNITYRTLDGRIFSGNCSHGQFIGKMTIRYPNGDFYWGTTRDFKKHGAGLLITQGTTIEATYVNDKIEGIFKQAFSTGSGIGFNFEGYYNQGLLEGAGIFTLSKDLWILAIYQNGIITKQWLLGELSKNKIRICSLTTGSNSKASEGI